MSTTREHGNGPNHDDIMQAHRTMGFGFPMTDVDCLWYDKHEPVGIVDWKRVDPVKSMTGEWTRNGSSVKAQRNLAKGYRSARCPEGLPFFVIAFQPGPSPQSSPVLTPAMFRAYAMTKPADDLLNLTGWIEGRYEEMPFRTMGWRGLVRLEAAARGVPHKEMLKAFKAQGSRKPDEPGFEREALQGSGTWHGFVVHSKTKKTHTFESEPGPEPMGRVYVEGPEDTLVVIDASGNRHAPST